MGLTVSTFVASSETVVEGDNLSAVIDEVLQLMLCTINRVTDLETVASQWAPIFAMKSSRYRVLFICLYIQSSFFFLLTLSFLFQFADFFGGVVEQGSIRSESLYKQYIKARLTS